MEIRNLPVGIQSFEKLRMKDYLYVDKTKYIWKLIESGDVYFLSRPRRFGKSMLISTLESYFLGKKELFKGLAIEALENKREKPWLSYPVITFSLSSGNYNEKDGLEQILNQTLSPFEKEFHVDKTNIDLPNRFRNLIEAIYKETRLQVVVLVDEYDKPLLETMEINKEQEERNRIIYKSFFSVLKDEDKYLKFVFFTGVTKFSKVSIFSDLNQLEDISLNDDVSGLCGITEEELLDTFEPEIISMARKQDQTREECISALAQMYDGYHFSRDGVGVYNPFSILSALKSQRLDTFWFETGTPTFLIRKLRNSSFTAERFTEGIKVKTNVLMDYRTDNRNPVPLFYQSGYLTIKGYDQRFKKYILSFPNDEVKYSFLEALVPYTLGEENEEKDLSMEDLISNLEEGNIKDFMQCLQALFASVPYSGTKQYENEWRNEIFLLFTLMGENVQCEVHSAQGRADCVVKTEGYIYVFEFKLDESADAALKQIDEKGYADPYMTSTKQVIKIGVAFSSEKRNIKEWKMKTL